MGTAVIVVLAAGLGTRVGADGNKAYLPLAGRSMLAWSLATPAALPEVARTVLVYRRGERDVASATVERELKDTAVELVEGGDTRHGSELNVLRHLAPDIEAGAVDVVGIHDAARPLARPDMFTTAISLARSHGGALPALPIGQLATVDGPGLRSVAPMGRLVRVQTPQAFRARELLQAYRCAEHDGFEGTDTSSCVAHYTDIEVQTFPGCATNLKVTYARDLDVAERLLSDRDPAAAR
ncbi:2-C-methyl-D-erythritol 4-phosphate cytidylyltransferase [Mycobacterium sp. Y57]|uniref:IspD/TarI family cytidylyltransferase n=1 Tax=Mycolicibacterium xanthum TaxID=2796469 RepID=UPI001C851608|nr:IspD/TarI family cytidylyltransferase [Mycolicibacterium xanthum]MBX7434998.1 2-C-methyl-D-erythritol 4-phosphate cytidylyltransferase [Mycolicibacterium xanthum]